MPNTCKYFAIILLYIQSFLIITGLQNSFAAGLIVKYYTTKSIKYIDLDRIPNFLISTLPEWINNYNRELSELKYQALILQHSIDYHTSGKNLYAWDPKAHLSFDFYSFFLHLFLSGGIFYVTFFNFTILLNIYTLWTFFVSIYTKSLTNVFDFIYNKTFFFILGVCCFFINQLLIFKFNLITLYPEEWAFALLLILIIFFLDLFWGATLLDFKIVLVEHKAYTFFKGLHFEFLMFSFLFIIVITILLDNFNLIESVGQNEYWTKWD